MAKKKRAYRTTLTWVDSVGPERYWNHLDDYSHKPTKITTIGWLVHENKKSVTISASMSSSGCQGGTLTIPKFAITKRKDG